MKWPLLISLMIISFLLFSFEKAPDFVLKDISGKEVRLSDFKGKVVLIDFFATWCPPCRASIPHLVELQREYGEKGLQIIGISLDHYPLRKLPRFKEKFKINYPLLMGNEEVVKKFGNINAIPTYFLLNRKLEVVKRYLGYRDKEVFERDIKKLLFSQEKQ
ncbi:MAG TPA: TlpA family protein disulfide reductase [bacterium]|nr:TlpA family protein disulfide reductase [bacterium]HEX68610.1 TlpA family protein disulfide reductase [bacterium]